jgi:hypothetical protein
MNQLARVEHKPISILKAQYGNQFEAAPLFMSEEEINKAFEGKKYEEDGQAQMPPLPFHLVIC